MAKKKPQDFNFEDALVQLEELVSDLEDGDLSLEDSLKSFEQGIKLTRECQSALQQAEQKVQILSGADGRTEDLKPLETQDTNEIGN
ncbi:MAG: exodeoxyribonuclease VII small subunit [SAR86 cluster bacterium]|uniref:Exodeoxyribonuclease 7 small subunit n=1 Tax=SAR86 cluster bacterium TaxID=2030880 RepID=A0A2A4MQY5_9GAMM|nr:MAG: exodeoxyribonuclease VII small subunit [SAR86 cluster bacterium]